jgi:hypothetical protein
MFGIDGKYPVPWERFQENLTTNGGRTFMAIEQNRYEECSVAPGPSNDVIIGSVLVNWTDITFTTLKTASNGDWPQAYAGWNISGLPKAIPFDSEVTILVEPCHVMSAFKYRFEWEGRGG